MALKRNSTVMVMGASRESLADRLRSRALTITCDDSAEADLVLVDCRRSARLWREIANEQERPQLVVFDPEQPEETKACAALGHATHVFQDIEKLRLALRAQLMAAHPALGEPIVATPAAAISLELREHDRWVEFNVNGQPIRLSMWFEALARASDSLTVYGHIARDHRPTFRNAVLSLNGEVEAVLLQAATSADQRLWDWRLQRAKDDVTVIAVATPHGQPPPSDEGLAL